MARLFGTDGVRGIANKELTPELAFRLGWAATTYFGRHSKCQPTILIGRDTRLSGPMLEAALAAGICAAGGKAVLLGVVPTPAVAYLTHSCKAQAGAVISASHNPYPDNGIKFFAGTGFKLPDEVEDQLEELVLSCDEKGGKRPTGAQVGTIEPGHELLDRYLDYLAGTIKGDLQGLRVVLDCANGAAFEAAPRILERLGAEVTVLYNQPDGININEGCGSTHLDALQREVLRQKAHVGIANDGDADRCLVVDEKGNIVDGDQIMVICALALLRQGKLKEHTLVATVMSNLGLHQAIRKEGGTVVVTPVGDRYVLEAMRASGFSLGGEQSGHIIFRQFSTTGDGILTALQLLANLKESGKAMSELAGVMTRFPQVLVNVRVGTKEGWQDNEAICEAIEKAEAVLGEEGRILVRASGTEKLIRVMAEGPVQEQLDSLAQEVATVIDREQA